MRLRQTVFAATLALGLCACASLYPETQADRGTGSGDGDTAAEASLATPPAPAVDVVPEPDASCAVCLGAFDGEAKAAARLCDRIGKARRCLTRRGCDRKL